MQHPYHNDNVDDASTLGSKSLGDDAGDDEDQSIIGNNAAPHSHSLPRIFDAGLELESLCRAELSGGSDPSVLGFPPLCLPIARLLAGNHCCVDCGDERADRLTYASIGYGTILCVDCAHRHVTEMEKESLVKNLKDEHWNLRSTLALVEGSNTKMLDYVKHKPRWRPPKGAKHTDSEDVLAFKQIYMSKGAATYRKDLVKKVDDVFYDRITQMRNEDAAREEERLRNSSDLTEQDPFRRILEMNNVSAEEIPGFMNASPTAAAHDSNNNITGEDGGGNAGDAAGSSPAVVKAKSARGSLVADRRKGRTSNISTPLMKHESPNIDLIRQRINMRRNMNPSISANNMQPASSMETFDNDTAGMQQQHQASPDRNATAARYLPHSSRRRITNDLVGEVGDASIQDSYYDNASISIAGGGGGRRGSAASAAGGASYVSLQRRWSTSHDQYEEDDRSKISYSSRARAPPLGMYRRVSSGGFSGGGAGDVGGGDMSQQRRPMYRPPKS